MIDILNIGNNARIDLDLFKSLLVAKGCEYQISWRWRGRSRNGLLQILKEGECIAVFEFYRNTSIWGESDRRLYRLQTGSARHDAVQRAIRHLANPSAENQLS